MRPHPKEDQLPLNPYAPPKSAVDDIVTGGVAPPLWNPSAAASWSLLFSPAFGAFLHMKNWQALGQAEKAASAKRWFVSSLVIIGGFALVASLLPDSKALDGLSRIVAFALLLSWYYTSGKAQAAFVKAHFGTRYPRRGWALPLLVGFGAVVVFIAAVVAVAVAYSMFNP